MKNGKKHIAFVIHNAIPVPYFNWFAKYAINQNEFRFSFIFLNKDSKDIIEHMREWNANVFWIPFHNSGKIELLKTCWKLYRLFKKIKPDVSHSHLFYDGVITLTAAKWAGIKVRVHTKQSTGYNWYYAPKAIRFDKRNNRLATHLIAVSEECKKFIIEKEKGDANKIALIHHGIEYDESIIASSEQIEEIQKRFNPGNKKLIIMVARYIDWKGYKTIINAADILVKKYADIRFLGIGTGPQEDELKKLITELKLEQDFILTGFIHRNLIPACYQNAYLYVHTASREPFGFVIPEAMMNGLPIVSTKTGAAGDIIQENRNGFLFEYGNESQLAEKIEIMLLQNESSIKKMGEQAKKDAIEKYSFENMWSGYCSLYRKALN